MSPAPTDTPGPRRIVGRYRLEHELGRGAMGTVWSAYDEVLHRPVAVKEVRLSSVPVNERAIVRERTLREARATAMLSHPNVVTLYDVVEVASEPYVVMELLPSRSLASYIGERGRLTQPEAAEIGSAVASALTTAHRAGITHRDVKPGNVLIGENGQIKLTDFGIARNAAEQSMTQTGTVLGSPPYIAPEVAMGRAVGPAADLWGLGATLFACLEGRPPYDAGDPVGTVTEVVHGDVPVPAGRGPVVDVIRGLMVKDPAMRMPLAAVRRRLRPLLSDPEGPVLATSSAPRTAAIRVPRPGPPSDQAGLIPASSSRGPTGTLADGTPATPEQPPRPRPSPAPRTGPETPVPAAEAKVEEKAADEKAAEEEKAAADDADASAGAAVGVAAAAVVAGAAAGQEKPDEPAADDAEAPAAAPTPSEPEEPAESEDEPGDAAEPAVSGHDEAPESSEEPAAAAPAEAEEPAAGASEEPAPDTSGEPDAPVAEEPAAGEPAAAPADEKPAEAAEGEAAEDESGDRPAAETSAGEEPTDDEAADSKADENADEKADAEPEKKPDETPDAEPDPGSNGSSNGHAPATTPPKPTTPSSHVPPASDAETTLVGPRVSSSEDVTRTVRRPTPPPPRTGAPTGARWTPPAGAPAPGWRPAPPRPATSGMGATAGPGQLASDPGPLPFTPTARPPAPRRSPWAVAAVVALLVLMAALGAVGAYALTRSLAGQGAVTTSLTPSGPEVAGTVLIAHADTDERYSNTGLGFSALVPAGWQQFRLEQAGGEVAVRFVSPDASRELRVDRVAGFYPSQTAADYLALLARPASLGVDGSSVGPVETVGAAAPGAEPPQQTVYRTTSGPDDRTTWTRLVPSGSDLWVIRLTAPSADPVGAPEQFRAVADSFAAPAGTAPR